VRAYTHPVGSAGLESTSDSLGFVDTTTTSPLATDISVLSSAWKSCCTAIAPSISDAYGTRSTDDGGGKRSDWPPPCNFPGECKLFAGREYDPPALGDLRGRRALGKEAYAPACLACEDGYSCNSFTNASALLGALGVLRLEALGLRLPCRKFGASDVRDWNSLRPCC